MADQDGQQPQGGYFTRMRQKLTGGGNNPQQGGPATPPPNGPQGTSNPPNNDGNLPRNDLGNESPLSLHEKLYDPITNTDEVPSFKLDSAKLKGVVDAQDFLQGVDPALLSAVQGGDMSKLGDLIQAATRNAYRASLEHGSTLTDKFVGARFQHSDKGFSSRVKGELTGQALSSIPGFQSPVVRQQLNDIANRLRSQHPDAPPQEIAEEAKRILLSTAQELDPTFGKQRSGQPQEQEETDWGAYLK